MLEFAAPEARRLATLIVIGGPLVLLSYLLVFASSPEMRTALWGGVPESMRTIYTLSLIHI